MRHTNRSESWHRLGMLLLALVAVACVWSAGIAAEAATTNTPAATTNSSILQLPLETAGRDFIKRNASVLSFGLDRIAALQPELLGRPRWQYVASLLYILLAFVGSRFVDGLIHGRLKAWAAKTERRWDDVLVSLADGPVKVVAFVIFLHIGLQLFDWPAWVELNIAKFTVVIVAISFAYVLLKGVDAVVSLWQKRIAPGGDRQFQQQFLVLLGKLAKVGICIVAILTVLPKFGVDITALLGSVSVLGLALGLAAQDTVANLFGAVAVFVDKPFRLGDRIQVAGIDGTVEEMGLRSTTVRSLDGFLITIPNKLVGNNTVVNVSRRSTIKTELNYGLTYDTSATRLKRASVLLEEIFRNHPQTADVVVTFNKYLDSALNLNVVHWWKGTDGRAQLAGLQELNLAVKERFDAEGLEFAFPTQTVYNKWTGSMPDAPQR